MSLIGIRGEGEGWRWASPAVVGLFLELVSHESSAVRGSTRCASMPHEKHGRRSFWHSAWTPWNTSIGQLAHGLMLEVSALCVAELRLT